MWLYKEETMPTDSCLFFYGCSNCKQILKSKKGDCCVFCSYGSVKCPLIQRKVNVIVVDIVVGYSS